MLTACTELDRARSTAKVGGFSGSLFNSPAPSVPSELDPLLAPQQIVSRVQHSAASAIKTANAEYDKIVDPAAAVPAPPVYAARLNGLMKSLASAEGAVAECVKARKELVGALERMLQSNREALEMEEAQLEQLGAQKTKIEIKKQEVEVAIIRDMSNSDKEHAPVQAGNDLQEPERPQMEALTPPHVQDHQGDDGNTAPSNGLGPHAGPAESSGLPQQLAFPSAPGIEMLSNLASQYHAVPVNGSNKKRKIDASEEFPDLGGDDGMDADVAEMIRRESRGNQSWA